jgi:hypothetical protein
LLGEDCWLSRSSPELAAAVTASAARHPGMDDDRLRLYCDLVYNSLNEAARRALEVWR